MCVWTIGFWAAVVGFFPAAPAAAVAEIQVYSLEQSIVEALTNNWDLKALDEKHRQAVDIKNQARADLLPRFRTSYSYRRLDEVSTYRSPFDDDDIATNSKENYQWRNSVTQPLFAGFALVGAYRLAELGIDQSEMQMMLGELDLALQVKEAYFNILVVDKTVDVARKEVEFLSSNVEVTRSYYEAGMVPVNDLLKAEMEMANARQNLADARNQAALTRSAFNTLLARPVNAPVDVEDILTHQAEPIASEEATVLALGKRPEIHLIDIEIQRAAQQIKLARSAYYPEVSFVYDYIREGDKLDVSGSPFHDPERWQATVVGSLTFWEWGKTRYAVSQKESVKEELTKTRNAVADSVRLDVREALLNLSTAEENIPTTEKAVLQGEENLRVNQEGYRAQMNTVTDVLDAQALLTRARVNYFKALYGYNLARARLARAMGTY
ncbi:MAG: TolC family protein [Desulfobacterales bacterium]|jgi:outer membrane protein TolC|nr:TolC family protein [Desulfobacterales bacterium]